MLSLCGEQLNPKGSGSSPAPRSDHATATNYLIGKGGYVFGGVGLSVCLFVCL